ncbi:uncharacterized protein [Cicer arietinum]|uniref:uncharacterized protein n=1 Tax=Cicer arietinum TaxID=3827 RepID=UPI003CC69BD9
MDGFSGYNQIKMNTRLLMGSAYKEGNMIVGEYAAKFKSLSRHFRFFREKVDEQFMCRRFQNGLKYEIQDSVLPWGIQRFQKPGYFAKDCKAPKVEPVVNSTKVTRPSARGRVYCVGAEAGNPSSNLIQRDCVIADNTLTALLDSRATHPFIYMECVNRLKLIVSSLPFDLVVSIPVKTLTVNVECTLSNCTRKLVLFPEPGVVRYLAANKLRVSLREGTPEFLSLANVNANVSIVDVVLVKEYPDVFPTEISGLPSCEFWLEAVNFLGHVITKEGIVVDPTKIETVFAWKQPQTITYIRSFVRLAGYYMRFIEELMLLGFISLFLNGTLSRITKIRLRENWTHYMIFGSLVGKKDILDTARHLLGNIIDQQKKHLDIVLLRY